jgi:hypothetical protein
LNLEFETWFLNLESGIWTTPSSSSNNTLNDFARVFGGGIDLRLIQFDYNPIFVRTRNGIEGKTQHNFRIGVGLVFH